MIQSLYFAVEMFVHFIIFSCFLFHSCHGLVYSLDESNSYTCSEKNYGDPKKTEDGLYLGSTHNSHISYSFNSENSKVLSVSLDVRTFQHDGMLFYVRGLSQNDFYALYFDDGSLHVGYNCDDFGISYTAGVPVNDGKWYRFQFFGNEKKTELTIEDLSTNMNLYTGKTPGCKNRTLLSPYYLGSVGSSDHQETAKSHLKGHNEQFVGCMRNIVVDSSARKNATRSGIIPCLIHAEAGLAFSSNHSYALVDEHFGLHNLHNLRMKIKPKTDNGILLFYQSSNSSHHLILELVNGSLKLTVSESSTTLNSGSLLCDGNWHTVFVVRRKQVYILVLDHDATASPVLQKNYDPQNIFGGSGPLYLGGVPATYAAMAHQYIGCINKLEINERQDDVFAYKFGGKVTVNLCPT